MFPCQQGRRCAKEGLGSRSIDSGTRLTEVIADLLARVLPDTATADTTEQAMANLERLPGPAIRGAVPAIPLAAVVRVWFPIGQLTN